MATRLPNDFVIIAPKGEKNSSISDEDFENYNDSTEGTIIELTLEEYGAWAITANSLEIKYLSSGEEDEPSVTMNLKRYKRNGDVETLENDYYNDALYGPTNPIWNGVNREFPLLDFPSMAPGHLNASLPLTSWFKATKEELYNPNSLWTIPVEPIVRAQLSAHALSGIKPFYHRDKFYLWFRRIFSPYQTSTTSVTPKLITAVSFDYYTHTITFTLKD